MTVESEIPAGPAGTPQEPVPVSPPLGEAPAAPIASENIEASPANTPAEPSPAVDPAAEPTLLEAFDKKPVEKPAEAAPADKPADAPKPEGAAPAPVEAAPAEPISYEALKLPEGFTADQEKMTALTGLLGENRVPPEAGQKLLDLHAQAMQTYATQLGEHMVREQNRVWDETRKGWRTEVMADPELGGSGHQTAMGAIARIRDMAVPEGDRPAFENFMRVTGAGDHPVFLRMLHNLAKRFDEPTPPSPMPKPPADIGGGKRGRSPLYNNGRQ